MNTKNITIGLLATLTLVASISGAQSVLPIPGDPVAPLPRRIELNDATYSAEKYYPTRSYAGSNCKETEYEYTGSGSYSYNGGYFNESYYDVEVICPITTNNDPYQKWTWSDVYVTDQSNDYNFWCELRKSTPVRGGWAEYSSGKVWSSGRDTKVQKLDLHPVPGGYTPDGHVYVVCSVPEYSLLGGYSEYSGHWDYYRSDSEVYNRGYVESHDYDGNSYNADDYQQYSGRRYR
jgi:hypothetical protein